METLLFRLSFPAGRRKAPEELILRPWNIGETGDGGILGPEIKATPDGNRQPRAT
jgi:hypothetical protein